MKLAITGSQDLAKADIWAQATKRREHIAPPMLKPSGYTQHAPLTYTETILMQLHTDDLDSCADLNDTRVTN